MAANMEQHHAFLPHLDSFAQYVKDIKEGRRVYRKEEFLEALGKFMDPLTPHLHDVGPITYISTQEYQADPVPSQEIVTLESSRLAKAMTTEELQVIDAANEKRAIAEATVHETLPLFMVCHNKDFGHVYVWLLKNLMNEF